MWSFCLPVILNKKMPDGLEKSSSGIRGLVYVTNGGLPLGRPIRVVGGSGLGKTLSCSEFLVRGARVF